MSFFSSRRGAELSFNMIVVAILAIVALVVMVFIFSSKSGTFGEALISCENKGGVCKLEASECTDDKPIPILRTDCGQRELPVCCVPLNYLNE